MTTASTVLAATVRRRVASSSATRAACVPGGKSAESAARRRASSSVFRTKSRAGKPAAMRRGAVPVEVSDARRLTFTRIALSTSSRAPRSAASSRAGDARAEGVELEQHVRVERRDVRRSGSGGRARPARAAVVGEGGDVARGGDHEPSSQGVSRGVVFRRGEAHGERVEVRADGLAPGEHRLDEHGARAAERIEHRRPFARERAHEARGRQRVHARGVGVEAVDVGAIGIVVSVGGALAPGVAGAFAGRGSDRHRLGERPGDVALAGDLDLAADVRERAPLLRRHERALVPGVPAGASASSAAVSATVAASSSATR